LNLTLQNDRIALTLEPGFGAWVTGLTDRATGRQWLCAGPCRGDPGEAAAYLGDQARGWDECFPTITPCQHPDWGGMRDHGLLWGRPWTVDVAASGAACAARYDDCRFRFRRCLALSGPTVRADYAATNLSDRPMAYLWCQHALLATTPRDRIALEGIGRMQAEGCSFDWPQWPGRDLTRIGPVAEGFALKAYAPTPRGGTARVEGPDGGIRLDWGPEVPAFGLWLSYGGWPDAGLPLHQLALEPATACADDLATAETIGAARRLAPGATHRWTVTLALTGPSAAAGP